MAARQTYTAESRLARRVVSHCASVIWPSGTASGGHTPWFTTTMSSPPRVRTTSPTTRWATPASPRSPPTVLHQLANHVLDREVQLLNAGGVVGGDHERDVGQLREVSPSPPQEGND